MNNARQVLTIKQVAEFLQVSTDTVYRLATSGELQNRKIGRIWWYPKDAVLDYVRGESLLHNDSFMPGSSESGGGGGCSSAAKPSRPIAPSGRVNPPRQSIKESSDDPSGL